MEPQDLRLPTKGDEDPAALQERCASLDEGVPDGPRYHRGAVTVMEASVGRMEDGPLKRICVVSFDGVTLDGSCGYDQWWWWFRA